MGMVPGADSFKKGETGVPPLFFVFFLYFFLIWLCKNVVKWVGSGRGRLRPVQNDRTGCPDVLGVVLAQNSYKQLWKKQNSLRYALTPPAQLPVPRGLVGPWLRVSGRKKTSTLMYFCGYSQNLGWRGWLARCLVRPGSVVISVVSNSCQLFHYGYFRFIFGVLASRFWGPGAPKASILEPFWRSGNVPARLGRPVGARGGSD